MESAYRVRIGHDGVRAGVGPAWMLFDAVVDSLIALRGPRADFLEDSLINAAIERVDSPALKLRETETLLHAQLNAARQSHYQLLESLFIVVWGPIERPLTSADLAKLGFDDSTEPNVSDYYDDM